MKKLICFGLMMAAVSSFAQQQKDYNPAWIAINSSEEVDIVGVRFTLPYGECESLTGFDFGFIGNCVNMYGLQINVLRNKVIDQMDGIQLGLINLGGDQFGLQVGALWNENLSSTGLSVGLVNIADHHRGFQIGLINRCESIDGYQIGAINVIRSSSVPFFPLFNFTFQ